MYAITAQGRRELRTLRAEALRDVGLRPDPVDRALAMSGDLAEEAELSWHRLVLDQLGELTAGSEYRQVRSGDRGRRGRAGPLLAARDRPPVR